MNLLHKFTHKSERTQRVPKLVALVVAVTLFVSGASAFAGWTPERTVLDWNNPDQRKGSMDGPRINTFINTPYYGDERAFFDARMSDADGQDAQAHYDVLEGVASGTREVVLRTYVHNGANEETNDGVGMARDAKVRITLPDGTASALRARSYISVSNPAPGYPAEVTDTTELTDDSKFSISYVPGSAKLYNAVHKDGIGLADSIVADGVPIGYETMDGNLPGCFGYQAIVEIKVKVEQAELDLRKQVRKEGATEYGKIAQLQPGETAEWLVRVQNKGDATLANVKLWDKLPPHIEVVPQSVRWIYRAADGQDRDVVQSDSDLFDNYVDFGNWDTGGGFYLRFDTVALDNFDTCSVTVRNEVYARADQVTRQADYADVEIKKEPCDKPEPPKPVLTCDELSYDRKTNLDYRFTTRYTAENGADMKALIYDFGDGSDTLVTDRTEVDHEFPGPGEYRVSVVVRGEIDGQPTEVSDEACEVVMDIPKPDEPLPKPEAPKPEQPAVLPVTGPASIVGLFMTTSIAGAVAHRVFAGRRY
jgi:uncharacterized repeat protein (TIGR01451 family)